MIRIKRLKDGMRMPQRKTDGAAGYDLYAPEDKFVGRGRSVVGLGFAIALPEGWYARIVPRSGFSLKGMCGWHNADVIEGTVDSDYRGEVGVIVRNDDRPFTIPKGTRIAQMIFRRYLAPELEEAEELDDTERAEGGFGSTGER